MSRPFRGQQSIATAIEAFGSLDALDDHLEHALNIMESNHTKIKSIVHWPWILNALLN